MKMTRKHFKLIAAALAEARQGYPTLNANAAHDYVSARMADALAGTNPRFNCHRFMAACGVVDNPPSTTV